MLNSNNNDNGIKKGQKSKKQKKGQLCICSTRFCALLCHCLPRLQYGTSRNFLIVYTCFIEEIHFFPLLLISTLVAIFSICHFLTATRTPSQRHAGLACLEIRSKNEEAINSTRNMIYSLKVFYFLLYGR